VLDGALPDLGSGAQAESEGVPQLIQEHGHPPCSISALVGAGTDRLATFALHRRMISSRLTAMNSYSMTSRTKEIAGPRQYGFLKQTAGAHAGRSRRRDR
jgi:hypothetical protein